MIDTQELEFSLQQLTLIAKQLSDITIQQTALNALNSLNDEQKKTVRELLIEQIQQGITNNSFRYETTAIFKDIMSDVITNQSNKDREKLHDIFLSSFEKDISDKIDYAMKEQIKELVYNYMSTFIKDNRESIEQRALEIVKQKLHENMAEGLAKLMMRELKDNIINKKFNHLLE